MLALALASSIAVAGSITTATSCEEVMATIHGKINQLAISKLHVRLLHEGVILWNEAIATGICEDRKLYLLQLRESLGSELLQCSKRTALEAESHLHGGELVDAEAKATRAATVNPFDQQSEEIALIASTLISVRAPTLSAWQGVFMRRTPLSRIRRMRLLVANDVGLMSREEWKVYFPSECSEISNRLREIGVDIDHEE